MTLFRHDRRQLATVPLLLLCAGAACARSTTPDQTEATKAPPATMLRLDLPPGVQVTLDGDPVGTTPLEPLAVQPGSRTVVLQNDCQRHEAIFELPEGGTKTLGLADAPTLTYATLHLRARNLAAEPLSPKVTLGDRLVGEAVPAGDIAVPTCKLRLTVTHPDLGGYLEDLDLQPGQELDRDIVLAPGPDMVHLPGGNFTLGPPPRVADMWRECCGRERYPVKIAPFELDRTEVTASQFRECTEAGACKVDPTAMAPAELLKMSVTDPPAAREKHLCNILRVREGRKGLLQVTPSREKHPANCIAKWQAEEYCAWVGKRLPTDVEWEYASRSGNENYDCPAPPSGGNGGTRCSREPYPWGPSPTSEVCSEPEYDSEQGICDLTSSVAEWVTRGTVSGRGVDDDPECYVHHAWDHSVVCVSSPRQLVGIGFRCARDGSRG